MDYWGVSSFENDGAADAVDAAFERVHGDAYDELMNDKNPLTFDQVQAKLANAATLTAAVAALWESVGEDVAFDNWDDEARLAFVGVVVRHAEFGVPIPAELLDSALAWLRDESIEWDEATLRKLRRQKEIALLEAMRVKGARS
jgi:hypothetical protein